MIHHTDGGTQYKANIYKSLLKKAKIKRSIAKNCLENGSAEQINGVIKNDYLEFKNIKNVKDLNIELLKFQKLYNEEKPVEALKYMTPVEFEAYIELLPKKEKPRIKLHNFNEIKTL